MSTLTLEQVVKQVMREYDRRPIGWQFLVGRNLRGNFDTYISNQATLWHVKTDTVYGPNPLGIGVRMDDVDISNIFKEGVPSYGSRPVNRRIMMRFIEDMISMGFPSEETIRIISSIHPATTEQVKESNVPVAFHGPIIHSAKPLEAISESQRELDAKLELELRKMVDRRYGRVYI